MESGALSLKVINRRRERAWRWRESDEERAARPEIRPELY